MDKLLKILKMVVDVAFKWLIDRVEFVDKLFKLLKMVVDVAFKWLIDKVEFVDKLFKLAVVARSGLFGLDQVYL